MSNLSNVLSTAFGTAITFLVPAIVWTTLAAGLCDLIRDRVRSVRMTLPGSRRLVRDGYGQQAN